MNLPFIVRFNAESIITGLKVRAAERFLAVKFVPLNPPVNPVPAVDNAVPLKEVEL